MKKYLSFVTIVVVSVVGVLLMACSAGQPPVSTLPSATPVVATTVKTESKIVSPSKLPRTQSNEVRGPTTSMTVAPPATVQVGVVVTDIPKTPFPTSTPQPSHQSCLTYYQLTNQTNFFPRETEVQPSGQQHDMCKWERTFDQSRDLQLEFNPINLKVDTGWAALVKFADNNLDYYEFFGPDQGSVQLTGVEWFQLRQISGSEDWLRDQYQMMLHDFIMVKSRSLQHFNFYSGNMSLADIECPKPLATLIPNIASTTNFSDWKTPTQSDQPYTYTSINGDQKITVPKGGYVEFYMTVNQQTSVTQRTYGSVTVSSLSLYCPLGYGPHTAALPN